MEEVKTETQQKSAKAEEESEEEESEEEVEEVAAPVLTAPVFKEVPETVTSSVGEAIRISCKISSNPCKIM